jgi:DNA-binding beta-propeller fold protein YncE
MSERPEITDIQPRRAIPGGEMTILCKDFNALDEDGGVYFDIEKASITAASRKRILVRAPEDLSGDIDVTLISDGQTSGAAEITIADQLADTMHFVGNPAVDPIDDSVVMTRSGGRGYSLPATLFRLEGEDDWDEMPVSVMNPTGLAFDRDGNLFVSNRANGEICRIDREGSFSIYASGLGIASGIAFDGEGNLFVGDRAGTIYRVHELGIVDPFADIEPSVAAFHIAFGPDERLYVSSPGLASSDAIYAVDNNGKVERFARGFGRPQGLAFASNGDLYAAACFDGRHGIVRIDPETRAAETVVAGNNIVGICFDRDGNLLAATNDKLFSIPIGITGLLLGS